MNIQNLNQQQNYLEKKLYENPPPSEKEDLMTSINEPNFKFLYQNSGTQDELYPFKDIEGFQEYSEMLEKDCLGLLGQNETSVYAEASKKVEVILIKIKN